MATGTDLEKEEASQRFADINDAFKALETSWKLEFEDGRGKKNARGGGRGEGAGAGSTRRGGGVAQSPGSATTTATASPSSSITSAGSV